MTTATTWTAEPIKQKIEAQRAVPFLEGLRVLIGWPPPSDRAALKARLGLLKLSHYADAEDIYASPLAIAEAAGIGSVKPGSEAETASTVHDACRRLQERGSVVIDGKSYYPTFSERVEKKFSEREQLGLRNGIPRMPPPDEGNFHQERHYRLVPSAEWLGTNPLVNELPNLRYRDDLGTPEGSPPALQVAPPLGAASLASLPSLPPACALDPIPAAMSLEGLTHPCWEETDNALGVGPERAYYALLVLGDQKAADLARVLQTSDSNARNWLNKLESHGLVIGPPINARGRRLTGPWHALVADLDEIAGGMDDSFIDFSGKVRTRTVLDRPAARAQLFQRLRDGFDQAMGHGRPSEVYERTSRPLDKLFTYERLAAQLQDENDHLRSEVEGLRQPA